MGITTPISTNPAMTIGGLEVGVTPLDMAHAYETIAHGGQRIGGTLATGLQPTGLQEVSAGSQTLQDGHHRDVNRVLAKRVLPPGVASTETSMLETVLSYGTAKSAAIGQFAAGKTGTTSNFGDAWFVGWDKKYTVAVWVGYPDKLIPMTTDFNGQPVFGGTYPALIWHDFMLAAMQVEQNRATHTTLAKSIKEGTGAGQAEPSTPAETSGTSPGASKGGTGGSEAQGAAPAQHSGGGEAGGGSPSREPAPAAPTPAPSAPSPPPSGAPPSGSPSSKSGGAEATGGVSPSG
jgi:penicillin-binding protein 1A